MFGLLLSPLKRYQDVPDIAIKVVKNVYLVEKLVILMELVIAGFLVLLINVPFGYWRYGTRRFSLEWFAAIHIPVPFVIGIRLLFDFGWELYTFPILISAFFLGQFIGGQIRRFIEN